MELTLLSPSSRSARRVIEVVGPAGAGKSTLLSAIARTTPRVRTDLSIWGQPRWRLVTTVLSLAPDLFASLLERDPFLPSEMMQMARVEALLGRVQRALRRSDHLLVLDEGPVFAMAWLMVFHPARGRSRRSWRRRTMRRWADLLAGVVHLDAEDDVIRRRIRRRAKAHPVKGFDDAEIDRFTEQFRVAFRRLLRDFEGLCGLPVAWRRTDGGAATAAPTTAPSSTFAAVACDD